MSFFLDSWAELKKKNKIKNVPSPPKWSGAPLRLGFADQLRTPVYLTPAKKAKLRVKNCTRNTPYRKPHPTTQSAL